MKLCEELVDAVYEENKFLIATFPQIAAEGKLGEVQRLLPDIKTSIQQKRSETPSKESNNDKNSPMDWRGFSVLLTIFGGFALLVWFIAYKRKRK